LIPAAKPGGPPRTANMRVETPRIIQRGLELLKQKIETELSGPSATYSARRRVVFGLHRVELSRPSGGS
jgi:hypothetical protein